MSISQSNDVERTLQKPDIHQQWESSYRTAENETFFEEAFDYITSVLGTQNNGTFLDAGCGTAAHSVRLAERGFVVLAIDFSESILKTADLNLQSSAPRDNIRLQRENILSLSFPAGTFDYILCWGVLMHIVDVEKAISELDRVLKHGGFLVISEANMFSIESIFMRSLKLLLGKEKVTVKKAAAGLEYWELTPSGKLLSRQANIGWLKKKLKSRGFTVSKHVSGQFTEIYTRFSSRLLRKFIHGFNHLWFKYAKIPYFAFGNVLILQKQI
ncbi:MAG: class I SAM-dependent methyltransferase [bacterium]|nr:class I SAM-dependent methyltransferase [bacterium]